MVTCIDCLHLGEWEKNEMATIVPPWLDIKASCTSVALGCYIPKSSASPYVAQPAPREGMYVELKSAQKTSISPHSRTNNDTRNTCTIQTLRRACYILQVY